MMSSITPNYARGAEYIAKVSQKKVEDKQVLKPEVIKQEKIKAEIEKINVEPIIIIENQGQCRTCAKNMFYAHYKKAYLELDGLKKILLKKIDVLEQNAPLDTQQQDLYTHYKDMYTQADQIKIISYNNSEEEIFKNLNVIKQMIDSLTNDLKTIKDN